MLRSYAAQICASTVVPAGVRTAQEALRSSEDGVRSTQVRCSRRATMRVIAEPVSAVRSASALIFRRRPLGFCQLLEDEEVVYVCFVLTQHVSLDLTRDDREHAMERAQQRDLLRVKFEGRQTSA